MTADKKRGEAEICDGYKIFSHGLILCWSSVKCVSLAIQHVYCQMLKWSWWQVQHVNMAASWRHWVEVSTSPGPSSSLPRRLGAARTDPPWLKALCAIRRAAPVSTPPNNYASHYLLCSRPSNLSVTPSQSLHPTYLTLLSALPPHLEHQNA